MKRMQPLVPANRAGINGGFDLRKLPFYDIKFKLHSLNTRRIRASASGGR
ncbi:hypothetical protein HZ326_31398, partial [Fusarium oxysporum f. sp. albedinis]